MAIWDNTRERSSKSLTGGASGFSAGTLLYLGCIAVTLFFIWPYIRDGLGGDDPMHGPNSYDAYGYRGDPGRFDRWSQGGQGGYSEYFPGPRTRRPDGPGGGFDIAGRRGGMEEGDDDAQDAWSRRHGGR
jgi:hypothetical protein